MVYMNRRIIQISAAKCSDGSNQESLFALCDDGTLWQMLFSKHQWNQVINVPQMLIRDDETTSDSDQ